MEHRWHLTVEDSVVLADGDLLVLGTPAGPIRDEPAELVTITGSVIRVEKVTVIYPRVANRDQVALRLGRIARVLAPPHTVIQSID